MAFTPPTLSSETIVEIAGFPIRNSMVMAWLAMLVLIVAALIYRRKSENLVPRGFQNLVEVLVGGLYNFFLEIVHDAKQAKKFFAVCATIFLFIITSNWMGILPGVGSIGIYLPHGEAGHESIALVHFFRTGFADINMTLALAIISVILTQFYGITSLGFASYAHKFFVNPFKDFVGSFVGLLELVSEFAKIISFSFRLFGNIFAGEVLLVVMGFLAPFIAPIPFYGLELFVGFVQALVFALLTLVFMKMAATSHAAH
ncbi:ATP synthase F0 subunit A [Candidatus Peregrinibacteria bacterium CG_4_9_14_0_2_um_filter_53_11]|nr:MAG: ATP synthase F0 subunit A [Candidatus Peregrinibacteria bacterium CG_4_9_14_0_2_um_filter_53_11]